MNTKIGKIGMVLAAMLVLSGTAVANISLGVTIGAQALGDAVVTILGLNPDSVERYSAYTDGGATAVDYNGSPLTVTTAGIPVDTTATGAKTITYTATGVSGVPVSAARTVNVVDTQAPAEVTGLSASDITYTSFKLTWTNPSDADFVQALVTVTKVGETEPLAGYDQLAVVGTPGSAGELVVSGLEASTQYTVLVQTQDDQP